MRGKVRPFDDFEALVKHYSTKDIEDKLPLTLVVLEDLFAFDSDDDSWGV